MNIDARFKEYRKTRTQLLRPYEPGENLLGVSVNSHDRKNGSPKEGDMIAVSKYNPSDRWLVAEEFYKKNYEPASDMEFRDHWTTSTGLIIAAVALITLLGWLVFCYPGVCTL